MRTRPNPQLLAWRHALLASLGVVAGCGGDVTGESNNVEPPRGGQAGEGGTATGGGGTGAVAGASGGVAGAGATGAVGATGGVGGDVIHRPAPADCTPFEKRPESQIPPDWMVDAGTVTLGCEFDADCVDRAYGYCLAQTSSYDYSYQSSVCGYGCATDADCDAGRVCECGGLANRCVTAACTVDADCGPGFLCLYTNYNDGCGARTEYHCQTPGDTCASNADCVNGEECGYLDAEGRHACQGINCAIGRPFLIDGVERLAAPVPRGDWCRRVAPTGALSPAESRELCDRWTTVGLMEHASIAAFARFALQLLELGAPPDLVAEATRAMDDERCHAEIAFGFASAHGGAPVGPGPLAMDRALQSTGLRAILVDVVREGCVGESVAAHEARIAADAAVDSNVKSALARIAADERRHAELAWRFVVWALRRAPELSVVVERTVQAELARAVARGLASGEDAWLAPHGIVPERTRHAIRVEVLRDMVLPCAEAIIGAPEAAA